MKAFEFVKKFGLSEFKELYHASLYVDPFQPPSEKIIGIKKSEIKELFDAFEFVNAHGSIDVAKKYVNQMDATEKSSHYNNLRDKIKLVEQCR
ncbi:MAG: hypothetical protein RR623_00370 [Bacilli bacterium]